MSRVVSAEQAASKCEQPLDRDNLIGAREGQRSGPGLLPIGGVTVPTGLALLWQIYSGRRSLQIHFRQCGHRCGGSRAKSSRMAWRTAGENGWGGGPVVFFFSPFLLGARVFGGGGSAHRLKSVGVRAVLGSFPVRVQSK